MLRQVDNAWRHVALYVRYRIEKAVPLVVRKLPEVERRGARIDHVDSVAMRANLAIERGTLFHERRRGWRFLPDAISRER